MSIDRVYFCNRSGIHGSFGRINRSHLVTRLSNEIMAMAGLGFRDPRPHGIDESLPQYSECGSPPQLLKISFFFRRRIANTINFSTPTLFFCIKSILNRNTISRNTSTAFLILNPTCDISYVCNCIF